MLTPEEIKKYIDDDTASAKKKFARVGQRYYEGNHDIRQYKMYFFDADGKEKEEKIRSNIKITHPFFTELVDQETQYMLSGKDGFIKSSEPKLQALLDEYFNENENFMAALYDVITGCIVKGFEYIYAYKNEDGRISFECADSLHVVEVKEKPTDETCKYVIHWRSEHISREKKTVKRIEVWDKQARYFFVQEGNGAIQVDKEQKPRPHSVYTDGADNSTYVESFGFIPFFRLDNCNKQHSGLKPIKDLIDDYDLMACGLSNNIQDTNESLYVVKGFKGNLDEMMHNMKAKNHINIPADGDVDIKTLDIPYEARKAKLELDEKSIYRFGMGFNSAQVGDGNITNIVIKSRYALLDLKCNKLEIRLKQFLRKLLKVVLDEINAEQGTEYQQKDVFFDFEREIMTNAADNAQMELTDAQRKQTEINTLLNLREVIDNETMMKLICEQLDIDYDDIKSKLPKEEETPVPTAPAKTVLEQIVPEDGDLSA